MRFFLAALISGALGGLFGWLVVALLRFILFHPANPRSAFGHHLPFTPSLWMRHREAFGNVVAGLFERELASGDMLRERLRDAELKQELEKAVAQRLGPLVEQPLGSLRLGRIGVEEAKPAPLASQAWARLLSSPVLAKALERAFSEALAVVKDLPLEAILSPDKARDLASSLLSDRSLKGFADRLHAWIEASRGGSEARPRAGSGLGVDAPLVVMRSSPEADVTEALFANLLPTSSLSPLVGLFIDALYDAAIPVVETFLNDLDTRGTIDTGAREIVRRAINRLTVMQRLIVGAANYERSIAETMPDTIEDLVSMVSSLLRSPSMREKARAAALEGWESKDSGGLGLAQRIGRSLSRDALWRAIASVLGRLLEEGPLVADRLAAMAAAGKDATLSSLLATLGLEKKEIEAFGRIDIAAFLSPESPAGAALLHSREAFISSFAEELASRSLSDFLDLDETGRAELGSWLADSSLAMLDEEADSIVAGLGLKDMIIEKMRSIDNNEASRVSEPAMGRLTGILVASSAMIGFLGGLFNGLITKIMGG